MTEPIQPSLNSLGLVLQLAGSLLLAWLFLLLRRYARRRRYFQVWGAAWAVLAIAIGSLAGRFLLMPLLGIGADDAGIRVELLNYVYQFAKLSFIALIVCGTMMYARGATIAPFLPMAVGISSAYALLSLHFSSNLMGILMWQAPPVVLGTGWSALRLLSLPPSRHGVGAKVTGIALLFMATTAVAGFIGFGRYFGADGLTGVIGFMVRFNPYIDLLLHMILGCGMTVMLMEEAKREVDDAHAELAVAHNELRRAALYDTVTGTLNRRAFVEGVGLELARAQFGAVMMLDLDDLKSVNDAHGHSAGDALLRHLSDALRTAMRPSDKLYRWGGDEFLLVLPGADGLRAHARLRGVIAQAASLELGASGQQVRLGVSIGSADYASAEEMQAAIERADSQMYEDKSRKKLVRGAGFPAA